jgi:hypothetical protein
MSGAGATASPGLGAVLLDRAIGLALLGRQPAAS